ncbi:MAG: hypothetical protein IKV88_08540 [Clostridia bacterium]|nr:hypothetical protein [Bacteroidales bacterium]MBR5508079.1 hypothetical protein [Clostridia bacterium]
MNIKVKDATLEKVLKIIAKRKKQADRGENATMFELAQRYELEMLESLIAKEFKYGN